MAAKYSLNSNYSNTTLNRKYLGIYNPTLTRDNLSDEVRTVYIENKYDRRPDLMAQDFLGSSRLWWVLVHYNREKIKDPIFDFVAGTEIVIPKKFRASGTT
jgi:hypothetical protein